MLYKYSESTTLHTYTTFIYSLLILNCSRLNGELSTYHNYMVKRLVDGNTYQVRDTKKHKKKKYVKNKN